MSRTLVYIASGGYKTEYEDLDYDSVYLVDSNVRHNFRSNKVKLLKCDALEAVEYFKKKGVTIDCLVCLCESVGGGGHTYATCSDTFMGYVMPVLAKDFLWICNDLRYYPGQYRTTKGLKFLSFNGKRESYYRMRSRYGFNFVSLNLPYRMLEINEDDPAYLPPALFSSLLFDENQGHVFKMSYSPSFKVFNLSGGSTIRLIQDSIWNHFGELDHLFISFKLGFPPMKDYFENLEKVSYYEQMAFEAQLHWAESNGLNHIGFTPHYWYQYDKNYQKQLETFLRDIRHPMTIDFFYMNSGFKTRHIKKAIKTIQREARHH